MRGNKWGVNPIKVDTRRNEILVYRFGTIGWGGNSGFQAINLAVQFGCKRIVLVGMDMHDQDGVHWHGKHEGHLRNPTTKSLVKWRGLIDAQRPLLDSLGVEVVNASRTSALTAYPKIDFSAAIGAA